MFSKQALLTAVGAAFVFGLVASLAVRPPSAPPVGAAQSNVDSKVVERIRWRIPLSSSRNLPGSGETQLWMAEAVGKASAGGIHFQLFDPGEIVPAFAITDAVRDRKVPAGHTWLGYDQGKIPASALFGATPFGLRPWAYLGWWFFGNGEALANEVYAEHNIKPLLCGITGPETAGWYAEPINDLDDIQGLKIRFAGIGGKIMQRAGASITMLPAGEIFQALETGVIDATEYSQPITDQALGFSRIAKYNYYPGWHQPFSASHLVINLDIWNSISTADQELIHMLCSAAAGRHLGMTESMQGEIIKGFPDIGVTAMETPIEILRELKEHADKVLDEDAAKDADFARVLASQRAFKENHDFWRRLAYLPKEF